MSTAIAVCHGAFGRTALYRLNRPLNMHAHREGHLIFHLQGAAAKTVVSGEYLDAAPDKAVAINPWEPHAFTPSDRNEGALFLTLYINPEWVRQFASGDRSDMRFGAKSIDVTPQIRHVVERVVSLMGQNDHSFSIDQTVLELSRICFEQSDTSGDERDPPSSFSDYRLRRSIKLMRENLDGEMELDSIARQAGLSRPHFFRLFRRQTGLTPNLFLNTLRMEKAIDNLIQTNSAVADIGFDLGFSCQSSFTRFFASNAGLSPSAYRRVAKHVDNFAT